MLTTKEAAALLGVSPQRITQLISAGRLQAVRRGKQWFVDEESLETRLRTVSKKGGRPKRGTGINEVVFTLMNRQYPTATVVYDTNRSLFSSISETLDEARLPLGVFNGSRRIAIDSFNSWWRNRGIPDTRSNLQSILHDMGAELPEELIMRNLGLSLSDQYWIRPDGVSLEWRDINFFNHDFNETAKAIESYDFAFTSGGSVHPDNTSDGNLAKRWIAEGASRILLKEGGKLNQEPFNEAVATALHQRLLGEGEFVPYELRGTGIETVSACPCFIDDNEEYIPAAYVERIKPHRNDESEYQHYVSCCKTLDIDNIELSLWKMIVCDDILANSDRHFRNFGIVRNVETLACRPAPIFDSGTSLWCNIPIDELKRGEFSFTSKQFEQSPARQMLLVEDMSWFSSGDLDGFVDEALGILERNPLLEERLPYVKNALQRRVERMKDIRDWA